VRGLLAVDMVQTAKGVIENMLDNIIDHGFVPNGQRVYYLNRSQPPFLTQMVNAYYSHTRDLVFLKMALPLLIKEYEFWMDTKEGDPSSVQFSSIAHNVSGCKHTVTFTNKKSGARHILNRFYVDVKEPRPESYKEDLETAKAAGVTGEDAHALWSDLAAAAESGWDFSSRWMEDGSTLSKTITSKIVPVDLNSVMYKNEHILSDLCKEIGHHGLATQFADARERRGAAIRNLLWDNAMGQWLDLRWDADADQQNQRISASNFFAPLGRLCE